MEAGHFLLIGISSMIDIKFPIKASVCYERMCHWNPKRPHWMITRIAKLSEIGIVEVRNTSITGIRFRWQKGASFGVVAKGFKCVCIHVAIDNLIFNRQLWSINWTSWVKIIETFKAEVLMNTLMERIFGWLEINLANEWLIKMNKF